MVAFSPAVCKQQDFPISPQTIEIIQKRREFFVSFEVDQVGRDVALHGAYKADRIDTEAEKADNRVGIGDGGGKSNFLHPAAGATLQAPQEKGQLPAPILIQERMDFVDDHHPNALQKRLQFGIGASGEHIQGFGSGENKVGAAPTLPFLIACPNSELETQTLCQDRGETPFQVNGQRSGGHNIENGLPAARLNHPLDARGQDRFGLSRTGCRLQYNVTTRQDRCKGL